MEPRSDPATDLAPQEIIAMIDQKALRLSGLLRDVDNHPLEMEPRLREGLDEILKQLACRVAATRALLRQSPPPAAEAASTA